MMSQEEKSVEVCFSDFREEGKRKVKNKPMQKEENCLRNNSIDVKYEKAEKNETKKEKKHCRIYLFLNNIVDNSSKKSRKKKEEGEGEEGEGEGEEGEEGEGEEGEGEEGEEGEKGEGEGEEGEGGSDIIDVIKNINPKENSNIFLIDYIANKVMLNENYNKVGDQFNEFLKQWNTKMKLNHVKKSKIIQRKDKKKSTVILYYSSRRLKIYPAAFFGCSSLRIFDALNYYYRKEKFKNKEKDEEYLKKLLEIKRDEVNCLNVNNSSQSKMNLYFLKTQEFEKKRKVKSYMVFVFALHNVKSKEEKTEENQEERTEENQEERIEEKEEGRTEENQEERTEEKQEGRIEEKEEGRTEEKEEGRTEEKEEGRTEEKEEGRTEEKQEGRTEEKQEGRTEEKQEGRTEEKQDERQETLSKTKDSLNSLLALSVNNQDMSFYCFSAFFFFCKLLFFVIINNDADKKKRGDKPKRNMQNLLIKYFKSKKKKLCIKRKRGEKNFIMLKVQANKLIKLKKKYHERRKNEFFVNNNKLKIFFSICSFNQQLVPSNLKSRHDINDNEHYIFIFGERKEKEKKAKKLKANFVSKKQREKYEEHNKRIFCYVWYGNRIKRNRKSFEYSDFINIFKAKKKKKKEGKKEEDEQEEDEQEKDAEKLETFFLKHFGESQNLKAKSKRVKKEKLLSTKKLQIYKLNQKKKKKKKNYAIEKKKYLIYL